MTTTHGTAQTKTSAVTLHAPNLDTWIHNCGMILSDNHYLKPLQIKNGVHFCIANGNPMMHAAVVYVAYGAV